MSTTGQRAHRRTTSISTGSNINSLPENNQRPVDEDIEKVLIIDHDDFREEAPGEEVLPVESDNNFINIEETIINNESIIPTPTDVIDNVIEENNPEFIDEQTIESVPKNMTIKLGKKNKTTHVVNSNLDDPDEDDNVIDYTNYQYIVAKPHFTHTDIIESLSSEQNEEYVNLQTLQKNTDDSLNNSCGSWQEKYTKLHKEILNENASQRYVTYICDSKINCGGLADRILGMASTFLFALLTDRAFLADWQVPLPLDAIFTAPNIDWSYDSLNPSHTIRNLNTTELYIIDYDPQDIDYHFSLTNWTTRYPDSFIKFYTNQGLIQQTFDSKYYSSKLKEIGLKPHTAFGCLMDYLFRPVPPALSFIVQYTALFALPSIFSVGIHIRTGNTYEQTHSLQDYSHFFRCADQLAQTYAPDKKAIYYLVTDSVKIRDEAYSKLDQVIISGLPIQPSDDYYDYADSVNNAIVENWILSKTDYRLAAFHSKQLHSTVSLSTTESKFLDCTREDAFTTFNQLANEWSIDL
ncbi:11073_t:CDS:2 [Entrophospora sp. SA101]|nr:11073_t:CDS:2 [Entrophospora sp. SA101]